jgi:type II secretory pathway predicted ATPase ExeA
MHREALTSLSQGIQGLRGFMALIAEPGMGKTTLLNKLMEELRDSARIVFLFQTQCNSHELLRYLLSELGIENVGMDVVAMHQALNEVLFREMLQGRRFVLIVDEAQNLHDSVLETIRLLSDFETTHRKLIQIVLAGQPKLVDTLMQPSLSQLRQRIAILTNLEPLCATETSHYIEHRLRAAGSSDEPLFTREALALIAERSQGTPRSINNLCFNALRLGYVQGTKTIDSKIVQAVVAKLDFEALRCPQQDRTDPQRARRAVPNISEQLASVLLAALAREGQLDLGQFGGTQSKASVTLTGKLTEKLRSRSWGKENEFRIQVSLERHSSSNIPVADRYYCCSFYVGEEQASVLRAGQLITIKIE